VLCYPIRLFLLALCLFTFSSYSQGQAGLTSSGGDGYGAGGTVSFSVGLPAYTSNSNQVILISRGVQHAFQTVSTQIDDPETSTFNLSVYPNPTSNILNVSSNKKFGEELFAEIYSETGSMLSRKQINTQESTISLSQFANGIYLLVLVEKEKTIQSFKIIKNS